MRDKRVLITGGAGLIGSHIADLVALEKPREIIVLDNFVRGRRDNLSSAITSAPVKIVDGDIRDRALLAKLFEGVDIVFHQAAIRITQCAEEPRLAFEVLAEGTFNVLEAATKAGVSKVVAASSASVLGLAESFPTTEEHHPYNNRTIYGAAKTFNEGLLRSFAEMYGLRYVALRYFNVYGPRMDVFGAYTEVLIRWMERLAAGMPPLIYGDGSQTMDFVDARDIARANLLAAKSDVTDEVFNVASGREISLLELAQMLSDVMGSSLEPQHKEARAVNGVTRRLADIGKAERLLGFKAEISMEQGLRDLVAWWQSKTAAAGGQAA
ncbi:NAD-dependent epimerase/dehydratase family protein [Rhizobium leguminosarum]|jgi:UDP-glucose 4-epimerase|uniref:NAD-dependent epimerase/dehydratase family protein n=1 Tax=Rhizobium leguminosarum TaxID=384 RepID=A0A444I1P8_RHILE|nr:MULTISPECIES: NAD-dependent epimerase/dehydratase family protein [Rhizobium]MBY5455913.1 NAD-dependent epimerase/dehydratase family protein [Rhizobium leguminosarum]RWX31108.1 NAD-dependent epimerase/dehydratase family protein [Rhizobium leguminosarum]UIJ84254.1 NAD-dependent epimerase/dehydratase family protein [Rhizobium leguminosarum]WSG78070.1 NAD-dependent epimerase/dehydratase family protein [Rhizobium beringeri]WSH18265.1 NAD-dependent epimerase/dehydratase family protein [Rhizobium 